MLQGVIALLLEVSNEKSAPRVKCLNALYSRQPQSLVHSNRLKKFTDVLQSVVINGMDKCNEYTRSHDQTKYICCYQGDSGSHTCTHTLNVVQVE